MNALVTCLPGLALASDIEYHDDETKHFVKYFS